MSFFGELRNRFKWISRSWNMPLADLDKMMDMFIAGQPTVTGGNVNHETAMRYSAFFSGVRLICQTIASLPIMTYKRVNDSTKRRYTESPVYTLLHDRANPYLPAFYWREASINHQILFGNSYSYIDRDRGLRPIGLYLMDSTNMRPFIDVNSGKMRYEYKRGSEKKIYEYDEILHIPGFGWDGLQGYSVLKLAAESLGLGLAYEEFSGRFIGQGAHIGGVLQTDAQLTDASRKNLKESFEKTYSGLGKSFKTIVLEGGVKYNAIGMPLSDAQFLESRTFQLDEIARWLGLPPHKIAEQSHATYSNVEAENLSFFQDTIRPYLVRNEAFINQKLAPGDGFCEFLFDAILRADIKTRYEAYNIARNAGVINADEWRAKENLDEIADGSGKKYWRPANMVDANTITEQPGVTVKPNVEDPDVTKT